MWSSYGTKAWPPARCTRMEPVSISLADPIKANSLVAPVARQPSS